MQVLTLRELGRLGTALAAVPEQDKPVPPKKSKNASKAAGATLNLNIPGGTIHFSYCFVKY
jgi:hypothetical protein